MRVIDADRLKEHIDKLPALPDGNFAGNHSALKALINMQPTVEPERKPGIWTHEDAGVWICEVCGEEVGEMGNEYGVPKYNFCPYCGADMTGRR
jgi:rubrerythrin